MKAYLDLPWNVLAKGDPGGADWANHPPVDRTDNRNRASTKHHQPNSWRDLFWERHDTIWWNTAGNQTAHTSSNDEGYNNNRDRERPHYVWNK